MQVRYLGNGSGSVWTGQVLATNAVLRFAVSHTATGPARYREVLDVEACEWDVARKLVVCTRVAQWPPVPRPERKRKPLW